RYYGGHFDLSYVRKKRQTAQVLLLCGFVEAHFVTKSSNTKEKRFNGGTNATSAACRQYCYSSRCCTAHRRVHARRRIGKLRISKPHKRRAFHGNNHDQRWH